jgi:hypothetical protein
MKKTIVAIAVCSALLVPPRSFASELPTWTLNHICAEESDHGACREFEAVARYQISGPWHTIPDKVQTVCLTEATTFEPPSYRMLRMCLEAKLLEMHQSARKARAPPSEQPR